MLDLNDLRVFAYVVELGSLSEAATALDIDKSSVSRYLARLEESLNTALLSRSTRKLQLTAAGVQLNERCRELLAFISEQVGDVGPLGVRRQGQISVYFPPEMSASLQSDVLLEFAGSYPSCRVELVDRADAERQNVDICLTVGLRPCHQNPVIGSLRQVICASPRYLKKHIPFPSTTGLDGHRLIAVSASRRAIYEALKPLALSPLDPEFPPHVLATNGMMALRLVLDGAGVGCFTSDQVDDALASGLLVRMFAELDLEPLYVSANFPSRRQFSPIVASFLTILKSKLSCSPELATPLT